MVFFDEWILSAPQWFQDWPQWIQNLVYQFYQTFIFEDRYMLFVNGLKITFIVTIGALLLGTIIGLLIATVRVTHDSFVDKKPNFILRVLNTICNWYLTIIRGTPMMVQLLIMCFVIMNPYFDIEYIVCGILTLGINSGAYVAEIVRSGIMSVDKGQMEAGRSLGFNYMQTMWRVIIPQAFKNILPALGNEMITLLKDTSLVSVITLRDVTKQAQVVANKSYQAYMPYISLAVIYLIIVMVMSWLLTVLERRLRKNER